MTSPPSGSDSDNVAVRESLSKARPRWHIRVPVDQIHSRAARAVDAGTSTVKITPERLLALTTSLLSMGVSSVSITPLAFSVIDRRTYNILGEFASSENAEALRDALIEADPTVSEDVEVVGRA